MSAATGPICTHVVGGLGNQIFQYAVGRIMADRHRRELLLDLGDFQRYRTHAYGLDRLHIRAREASEAQRAAMLGPRHGLRQRLARYLPLAAAVWPGPRQIEERSFRWQELPPPPDRGLRLHGYWQSWRYLLGAEAVLRADLRPKAAAQGRNAALMARLRRVHGVAVHVRRGDYVSNPSAAQVHGTVDPAWYKAALKALKPPKGAPVFIFSDEPAWAASHLRLAPRQTVVDWNKPSEPEKDLWLMASCRSLAIANSTLSWWAAWLSGSERVAAPAAWFRDPSRDTRDLCPPAWLRL